jgi:hypothetical protein
MLLDVAGCNADGVRDIRFGPGFFEAALVGFQVSEMEEIPGPDVFEEDLVLVVVKEYLEIFAAADTVVVVAFGAYEYVLPEFRYRTDIVTVGTFGPESFGGFFFFSRAGQDAFFDASEPTALAFLALSFIAGQIRFKIVFVLHLWSFVVNSLMYRRQANLAFAANQFGG